MKAYVVFRYPDKDWVHLQLNNHKFDLSGNPADAPFNCIPHSSYDCWEDLSEEELDAINNAEEIQ